MSKKLGESVKIVAGIVPAAYTEGATLTPIRTLQVDRQNNTITQLVEIAKALTIPRDKNGRTVFDQYQPENKGTAKLPQENTYNISVSISRDPNDNEDDRG